MDGGGWSGASRLAGVGFGVAAEGGRSESGVGPAVAAGDNRGLALDRAAVAQGSLAQRRQRRPFKIMKNICQYSVLTPLRVIDLTGSRYPSRKLWINYVLQKEIPQGPISSLWNEDPNNHGFVAP